MVTQGALNGACLCGAVRYQAAPAPVDMWFCHCQSCRKASGAAFASWLAVGLEHFSWVSGAQRITTYRSSAHLQRCFCAGCGAILPALDEVKQQRWLPAGGLQGELGARPRYHAWVASKPPWFSISDGLPCYRTGRAQNLGCATPAETLPQDIEPQVRGSCLCGAVGFALGQPVEAMRNCHCSRCNRSSGSDGFTGLPGLADNLVYERGEDLLCNFHLPESRFYHRRFCAGCGSAMPGKLPGIDRTLAAAGTLDNDPGVRLGFHLFTGSLAACFAIDDGLPQFEAYPPQGFRPDA